MECNKEQNSGNRILQIKVIEARGTVHLIEARGTVHLTHVKERFFWLFSLAGVTGGDKGTVRLTFFLLRKLVIGKLYTIEDI